MTDNVLIFPGLTVPKTTAQRGGAIWVEAYVPICGKCLEAFAIVYRKPEPSRHYWRIGSMNTRPAATLAAQAIAASIGSNFIAEPASA